MNYMNKIFKILSIPIIIISLIITSNTLLYSKSYDNDDMYVPSRFAIIPYASIGYFKTDYNCDVNLPDETKKLEAKASLKHTTVIHKDSSYAYVVRRDTSYYWDYTYTIGAKFEIRIFKHFIFTPEIEFEKNKLKSYKFNDENLVYHKLPELNVGHTSRYINIPLLFNFYFGGDNLGVVYIGIGPKIHYNITKEEDQLFPVNPYFISGSAILGGITKGNKNKSGSIWGIFVDKTITNIYKDEVLQFTNHKDKDIVTDRDIKVSSIFGKNLRIGLMLGWNFSIID